MRPTSTFAIHRLVPALLPALLLSASLSAQADAPQQSRLKFYPALFGAEGMKCPEAIPFEEITAPYTEGGYSWSGTAHFEAFAGPFVQIAGDPFSVVWSAPLKPAYARCEGTAGPEDDSEQMHHLRLKLLKGKAILTLDVSGIGDANGYTLNLLSGGVKQGLPIWRLGGTD